MNKKGLIEQVAKAHELSNKKAKTIVDDIFNNILGTLAKGEVVQILGFGTWTVKHREKRSGRNPHSGKPITIGAKKVAVFKAGSPLKDAVKSGKVAGAKKPSKASKPAKKAAPAKSAAKKVVAKPVKAVKKAVVVAKKAPAKKPAPVAKKAVKAPAKAKGKR